MTFLKDNIIFVFGVLSLIGLILAAPGMAKSNFLSQNQTNQPEKDATKITNPTAAPTPGSQETANHASLEGVSPTPATFPQAQTTIIPNRPNYSISGARSGDDGLGSENEGSDN